MHALLSSSLCSQHLQFQSLIHMFSTITTVSRCRFTYQCSDARHKTVRMAAGPTCTHSRHGDFLLLLYPSSYDDDLSCLVSCIIGRFSGRLGISGGIVMGSGSASLGLWYYGLRLGSWGYSQIIKFTPRIRNVYLRIPRDDNGDGEVNVNVDIDIDVSVLCVVVTHVTHITCNIPFLHMHTHMHPASPDGCCLVCMCVTAIVTRCRRTVCSVDAL